MEGLLDIKCPSCGCDAVYLYGKAHTGKDRFKCLVCGRQFTLHPARYEPENRPLCPVCGRPMHVYMRGPFEIRFRCSGYPECRTYKKIFARPSAKEKAMEASTLRDMISPSCDIKEFVKAVKDKRYLEMLGLADKEALKAWRRSLFQKEMTDEARADIRNYESALKEFIYLMRAAVIPKSETDPNNKLFRSVRTVLLGKETEGQKV
jgi:ssDNA-binding Zn-finger/Zn-ribbon topoisomerase 1